MSVVSTRICLNLQSFTTIKGQRVETNVDILRMEVLATFGFAL